MKHLFFLLALLLCLSLSAQQTYRARVVDAETGEALPYVCVHTSSKAETMTNAEGSFSLKIKAKDILIFSLTGYEERRIRVANTDSLITMKPLQCMKSDMPTDMIEIILRKVQNRIDRTIRSKDRESATGLFLYRFTTSDGKSSYLGEAIVRAKNANNLRELEYVKKTFYNEVEEETNGEMPLYLQRSLVNFVLQLGPRPYGVQEWSGLHMVPFSIKDNAVSMNYNLKCSIMKSAEGEKLYKIEMQPLQPGEIQSPVVQSEDLVYEDFYSELVPSGKNFFVDTLLLRHIIHPQTPKRKSKKKFQSSEPIKPEMAQASSNTNVPPPPFKYKDYGTLAGVLYLDKHFRPLTFEGELLDYGVEMVGKTWTPAKCRVRIDYTTKNGKVFVKSAFAMLKYDNIETHAMMYSVPQSAILEDDYSSYVIRTKLEEEMAIKYLESKE